MWNNDEFSPETVDEQIERFVQVQSRQHLNAVLTQELKVMCEEDRAMVERVWARYAARIGTRPALDEPAPGPSPASWTNAGAFSAVPAQQKARPARRSRRVFALVAVVLVAVVLVGSALWVGNALHQPGGVAAHPTVTPQLTRTQASTPTPIVVLPALAPSGRVNAQLVYDDATNALLLFSGQDYTGAAPLADTWTWNGSTWARLHPAHSPGPLEGAAIAYDPTTQQVVLFGGMSNANTGGTPILGDTWTWNGSDWTQQHPASSPPARMLASLAYDAASGQLVLFGGKHATGFGPDLNDTWIWTGSNWVQQHPATVPTAGNQASLAYDGASGQLVLFGGQDATGYGVTLNDTWIWTGSNWLQQHPKTTPALSATLQGQTVTFAHPSMVYNPIMGKLMLTLIGQGANDGTQADYWTQADWTWNGSNWTEVNATGPAVEAGQIFYDAHLHTVFEFTSFQPRTSVDVENKLWKWTGQTWAIVESW